MYPDQPISKRLETQEITREMIQELKTVMMIIICPIIMGPRLSLGEILDIIITCLSLSLEEIM